MTVARRHGVNANQVVHWRKLYQAGLPGPPARKGKTRAIISLMSSVRSLPLLAMVTISLATAAQTLGSAQPTQPTSESTSQLIGVLHEGKSTAEALRQYCSRRSIIVVGVFVRRIGRCGIGAERNWRVPDTESTRI